MKWLITILICCVTAATGCRNASSPEDESGPQSAESVQLDIEALQNQYRTAQSYSDKAQLVLRYSLQGVPYEESHPFHSKFTRDGSGELLWFKHQTQSNGNVALSRILDLKTENFDGQVVVEPGSIDQITVLLETRKINRHFLAGLDDVPWELDHDRSELTRTVGLAYCLFYDWPSSWFKADKLIGATKVTMNSETYIDARFQSPWGEVFCRIDPAKNVITGIRFPQNLLAKEISASPEIRDVSLALLFNDAQFDSEVSEPVDIKLSYSEKPVAELITLPEAFPSERIGQKMPEFELQLPNGGAHSLTTPTGSSIRIGFSGDLNLLNLAEKKQLGDWSRSKNMMVSWIQPISRKAVSSEFQVLLDPNSLVLKYFVPKTPEFCFIVDAEGVVQYFGKLKMGQENGLNDLDVAIKRVLSGEDLSREMHNEYARYFEQYRTKLKRVRPVQALIESIRK